jgi:hypothetical protein
MEKRDRLLWKVKLHQNQRSRDCRQYERALSNICRAEFRFNYGGQNRRLYLNQSSTKTDLGRLAGRLRPPLRLPVSFDQATNRATAPTLQSGDL